MAISMSQLDKLAPEYPQPDVVTTKSAGKRSIDWAVLVVMLALGVTLAWIYLLFRAVVYAVHVALA